MTIQEGYLQLVQLLLSFGAELTEGNRLGRTGSFVNLYRRKRAIHHESSMLGVDEQLLGRVALKISVCISLN